jgi:hypothetical protein
LSRGSRRRCTRRSSGRAYPPCSRPAGGLSTSATASAYVLAETASGTPAHWQADHIDVVIDPSIDALGPAARDAVETSFATWRAVSESAVPEVGFTSGVADPIGYRANAANANTVRYVAGGYPPAGSALSITIATYDMSGAFVDADVVINGLPGLSFAVLDPSAPPLAADAMLSAPYDLQNVVTHEAGHFFGMAHANDLPDDTMFPTSAQGETKKRTLGDDDAAGIRSLYPDAFVASCNAGGRSASSSASWLGAAGLLVAGAAIARRRSNARVAAGPFAAAALLTFAAPGAHAAGHHPSSDAATAAEPASANATVLDTRTWWESGVAFTAIDLDVVCLSGSTCPARRSHLEVVDGTVDGLTQIVSGRAVPAVGERIALPACAGGYAWPEHLAPARTSRAASLAVLSTKN